MSAQNEQKQKRQLVVVSKSPIKVGICEAMSLFMSEMEGIEYVVIPVQREYGPTGHMIEQPFGSMTYTASKSRINKYSETKLEIKLGPDDLLISFENGINRGSDSIFDFCVMSIQSGTENSKMSQYTSFGIEIDRNLYQEYESHMSGHEIDEYGADQTFGDFLALKFHNVKANNWMSDIRFGNIDRTSQLQSCVNKFYLNRYARYIQDFPREGVLFKDITPIMDNSSLLSSVYSELSRIVEYNFDRVDYFAGLDARGFYFAPVLAQIFGKGFIPVRKAKKLPVKNDSDLQIVTESYTTEYSEDEFGLIVSKEYLGKRVLILDDLLATGGSIIGSAKVLTNAGLNVLGAITVYDVEGLRDTAYSNLSELPDFKVVTLVNSNQNICSAKELYSCTGIDMKRITYPITDIMIERIRSSLTESNKYQGLTKLNRRYTLSTEEWIDGINFPNKLYHVKVLYTDKDEDLARDIIDVLIMDQHPRTRVGTRDRLGVKVKSGLFPNGESHAFIMENIRNCHVFIISRIRTGHINDDLMQLYLIMDACNRACVSKKTVILPYYPYSRSDKKDAPRTHIGAAVQASFLTDLGIDNLVSVDLHAGQLQGLISKGFHNLYIQNYLAEYIYMNYLRYYPENEWNDKFVLIAPDAGSTKAIKAYSDIFEIDNIALDKSRNYKAAEDGKSAVNKVRFIGDKEDFAGKVGLIIDDMADTMGTMSASVKTLVENGLNSAIVFVTHGVLSGPAMERIDSNKHIKEVVVSDTLPQEENKRLSPKLRVISTAELLGRTIDGILTGRSISRLVK